jgi:hypothetical protein
MLLLPLDRAPALIVLERNGEPPWIRPHRGMVYRTTTRG